MNEAPRCLKQKNRMARKQHKCLECGGIISPGEEYIYSSGVWDFGPAGFTQCVLCSSLFDALTASASRHEGPCFGEMVDYLSDCGGPDEIPGLLNEDRKYALSLFEQEEKWEDE